MVINNIKHQKMMTDSYYTGLPVNSSNETPLFESIIAKIYREITLILARYSRVVLVRLDLHPKSIPPDQVNMTEFRKSFTRKIQTRSLSHKPDTKYLTKVAYCWVKESGRNEYNQGIHWHLCLAVKADNNLQPHIQAKRLQGLILGCWESMYGKLERNHRSSWFYLKRDSLDYESRVIQQALIINNPDNPEDMLFNAKPITTRTNNKNIVLGGVIDETFYAVSYLAKVYSKVRTPSNKNSRIFGSSNIGFKDRSEKREIEIQKNWKEIKNQLSTKIEPKPVV